MNQKEMAKRVGVSLRTLQRYEDGSKVPDVSLLVDFALSGYNVHWIITGDGNKYHWKQAVENEYLCDVSLWLKGETAKESKTKEWFEVQFEIAFPTFKEWRNKKKLSMENDI